MSKMNLRIFTFLSLTVGFSLCQYLNEPPKPYHFEYEVSDASHGDYHGHMETKKQDGTVSGAYFLLSPDGLWRQTKYSDKGYGFETMSKKTGLDSPPTHRQGSTYTMFQLAGVELVKHSNSILGQPVIRGNFDIIQPSIQYQAPKIKYSNRGPTKEVVTSSIETNYQSPQTYNFKSPQTTDNFNFNGNSFDNIRKPAFSSTVGVITNDAVNVKQNANIESNQQIGINTGQIISFSPVISDHLTQFNHEKSDFSNSDNSVTPNVGNFIPGRPLIINRPSNFAAESEILFGDAIVDIPTPANIFVDPIVINNKPPSDELNLVNNANFGVRGHISVSPDSFSTEPVHLKNLNNNFDTNLNVLLTDALPLGPPNNIVNDFRIPVEQNTQPISETLDHQHIDVVGHFGIGNVEHSGIPDNDVVNGPSVFINEAGLIESSDIRPSDLSNIRPIESSHGGPIESLHVPPVESLNIRPEESIGNQFNIPHQQSRPRKGSNNFVKPSQNFNQKTANKRNNDVQFLVDVGFAGNTHVQLEEQENLSNPNNIPQVPSLEFFSQSINDFVPLDGAIITEETPNFDIHGNYGLRSSSDNFDNRAANVDKLPIRSELTNVQNVDPSNRNNFNRIRSDKTPPRLTSQVTHVDSNDFNVPTDNFAGIDLFNIPDAPLDFQNQNFNAQQEIGLADFSNSININDASNKNNGGNINFNTKGETFPLPPDSENFNTGVDVQNFGQVSGDITNIQNFRLDGVSLPLVRGAGQPQNFGNRRQNLENADGELASNNDFGVSEILPGNTVPLRDSSRNAEFNVRNQQSFSIENESGVTNRDQPLNNRFANNVLSNVNNNVGRPLFDLATRGNPLENAQNSDKTPQNEFIVNIDANNFPIERNDNTETNRRKPIRKLVNSVGRPLRINRKKNFGQSRSTESKRVTDAVESMARITNSASSAQPIKKEPSLDDSRSTISRRITDPAERNLRIANSVGRALRINQENLMGQGRSITSRRITDSVENNSRMINFRNKIINKRIRAGRPLIDLPSSSQNDGQNSNTGENFDVRARGLFNRGLVFRVKNENEDSEELSNEE